MIKRRKNTMKSADGSEFVPLAKYCVMYKIPMTNVLNAISKGLIETEMDRNKVCVVHDWRSYAFIKSGGSAEEFVRRYNYDKPIMVMNGFDITSRHSESGEVEYKAIGKRFQTTYRSSSIEELLQVVESDATEAINNHSWYGKPQYVLLTYAEMKMLLGMIPDTSATQKLRNKLTKKLLLAEDISEHKKKGGRLP